ncbi:DPP IV N-terminal domain-containing protein [Rubripirellula sp.]|nr:S9 family peptidase [Rubripirellula sp.]MDB4644576.1 DPP IV N-terminal domain-containing protein [Rubripirellula sp.]
MTRNRNTSYFSLAVFQFLVPFAFVAADEPAEIQPPAIDAAMLTINRIYDGSEFSGKSFSGKWLSDTDSYTTLEATASGAEQIVRHEAGAETVVTLVNADDLTPAQSSSPLKVEAYTFSPDQSLLLIYTNSKRVWRNNTRGDYWVLDRAAGQLKQLGGEIPPSTMMFAKFSPSGKQIAYVHDNDVYVEDLLNNTIQKVTKRASDAIINGTTDWVYEEELGLRDAFMWSPDGKRIAFWQLDTSAVPQFPLVNHTDSLYPEVTWFGYPKVGQNNAECRVGMVEIESGETKLIELPGNASQHYIPRMEFLPQDRDVDQEPRILIQQLNRLQNTNRLFLADFRSNTVSEVMVERDAAWIDVHDELNWLDDASSFTWMSERDGWRHLYLVTLDDGATKQITSGDFDVIELLKVNEADGLAYFIASPDEASQRYLYRVNLDGTNMQRVTPAGVAATHSYKISPDAQFAIHQVSRFDEPPAWNLVTLPDHKQVRVLESNEALRNTISALARTPTEFFRVTLPPDESAEDQESAPLELEAWCMLPPNFDKTKSYPLLIYVYGEPAGTTVVNRWSSKSYLWHQMLAQQGYVVMSFDNRGTKSPRGRAWRKSIYRKIGIIPPADQAAAARMVLKDRSYLDPDRVGIWGWSGGGSSSLHAIFKHPDLYSTAVAVAPVPNQRYYDTIYQERYMGLPDTNVEGFKEGSPINFANQLEGNLLLVHGTGDDNCHYQTLELLINELIKHNKQFSMMSYPNRTHSIREGKNTTRHLRDLMTRFIQDNLPANVPPTSKN